LLAAEATGVAGVTGLACACAAGASRQTSASSQPTCTGYRPATSKS
jgi:hypothetical protein